MIPNLEIRSGKAFLPSKAGYTAGPVSGNISEVGVIYDPAGNGLLSGGNCVHSPLMANFDEKQIELSDPKGGVPFDLASIGIKSNVAWPTKSSTAFLALDLNKNGNIDNAEELFGSGTKLADGSYAKNGFKALARYDSNDDKFITKEDKIFSELRFWFDKNRNGISEKDELQTMDQKNIVRLLTEYSVDEKTDKHGNLFREVSMIEKADRYLIPIYDVWLLKD